MPDPEAPVAAPSDGTPAEPVAPAPEPTGTPESRSLGSLQDAFRADPDGLVLKGSGPRTHADRPPGDAASPEESAPEAATAADGASKPGEGEPRPSRRGAAAAIAERDAEIERLVAERRSADDRAREQQQRLEAIDRRQQEASREVLALIGDDADFERLQSARLHNRTLSYEEDERLDRMLEWRTRAQTFWQLADRGHRAGVARAVGDRVDRYGLDRERTFGSDLPGVIDHAVGVTEARVRAESAERIRELEKELEGLRTRAAATGRHAPTTGGGSAGSGPSGRMPEDGAAPMDWFRAGAREREAASPRRNGR